MQTSVIKLITGEEIIGQCVESVNPDYIHVKDPLSIVIQPTEQGMSYGFIPWVPLLDGVKEIKKTSILCMGPAEEKAADAYKSMFSQIITPPSKRLLV